MSRREDGHRGQPVWRVLTALVLLPIVAATVAGGLTVTSTRRLADQAERAQRLVTAVERIDALRQVIDAEALPTMLLAVLQDEHRANEVGFAPSRRSVLLATEPVRREDARMATDQALTAAEAASGTPQLRSALTRTGASLTMVRTLAVRGVAQLSVVAADYAAISDSLASVQQSARAQAVSAGLSSRSVAALQDLDLVLQLSESASKQLADLFASRVVAEPAASVARQDWMASWGTYTQLAGDSSRLSSTSLRSTWNVFYDSTDVMTFSEVMDRQALNPDRDVLQTGALPGLTSISSRRDDAVAVVLSYAVEAVSVAVRNDRAAAVEKSRLTFAFCLTLIVLSLLNAGWVARWLAGAMGSLAGSARRVSLGHLVDVPPRGPRELRTAALALSSAVAGLRRMQEQARAVVAGDFEAAMLHRPLPGPLGEAVHASVEQIVDAFRTRAALQDELTYQASHDALTGLPNRAEILRGLSVALAQEATLGLRTGVLFIDLDGFKAVNDSHGHAAGDELLREIARRLAGALRPGDTVGRLGGDEFVVTVNNVRNDADLVDIGNRLISAVSQPVLVNMSDDDLVVATVGASIGIAVSSADGTTADELLADADAAAYRAKGLGRGRVEVFDEALRDELAQRANLETALRQALQTGTLSLHYQPVVSLGTGDVVGYEALTRWIDPELGEVSPEVFITVASSSSLICDLGRWTLNAAMTQVAHWRSTGLAGFGGPDGIEPTLSVNISRRHLGDQRVVADVADALEVSGWPAGLTVLEVTEAALTNTPQVRQNLLALRTLGISLSIDDFGTGPTSINALSSAPADILKIDRGLFGSDDPTHWRLTNLITVAAHTLSMRVVAEGVETLGQLARAQAAGCDEAQGYLFSRPLPPEAFLDGGLHDFWPDSTIDPIFPRSPDLPGAHVEHQP